MQRQTQIARPNLQKTFTSFNNPHDLVPAKKETGMTIFHSGMTPFSLSEICKMEYLDRYNS